MKHINKITLLFTVFIFTVNFNLFCQDDYKKTYDSEKVIDSLYNSRHKVVQAFLKSQTDSINLFEIIEKENFVLGFMHNEERDSLALVVGNIPEKIFLAGQFIYSYTLNENDEKCDIYNGSGMHLFQKEKMGAIFSVQMVPNSLEDFGIEHYVLWIIFEDNSNIHFRFKK